MGPTGGNYVMYGMSFSIIYWLTPSYLAKEVTREADSTFVVISLKRRRNFLQVTFITSTLQTTRLLTCFPILSFGRPINISTPESIQSSCLLEQELSSAVQVRVLTFHTSC